MLCEQCGKNNLSDATTCSSCGAPMPQKEKCNGFADILTYTPPETPAVSEVGTSVFGVTQTEGISEQDMKKIIKKTDNIIQFSQKNILISLASVVIGFVIIFFSMYIVGINNDNKDRINELEEKIDLIITESGFASDGDIPTAPSSDEPGEDKKGNEEDNNEEDNNKGGNNEEDNKKGGNNEEDNNKGGNNEEDNGKGDNDEEDNGKGDNDEEDNGKGDNDSHIGIPKA